jgi:hypothetical protein
MAIKILQNKGTESLPASRRLPTHKGGRRSCSAGCGTILSSYNRKGICRVCEARGIDAHLNVLGGNSYRDFPSGLAHAGRGRTHKKKQNPQP